MQQSENALDVFVARQPITTASLDLYGYELLFRSGPANEYNGKDALSATSEVVNNTIFSLCENRLSRGTRAFVNLPRELILDDRLQVVSPDVLVLEILETIEPDESIIAACKAWKNKGYVLALDDFEPKYFGSPLTGLVDIIKVDFRSTTPIDQAAIVNRYRRRDVEFLAEKVETEAEFIRAKRAGYSLFQGYFFARPKLFPDKQIPGLKVQYLRILSEANQAELNIERIAEMVSSDVSLTCKLLAFVNSAAFMMRGTVRSVRQALVLLGEAGTRRWISLAVLLALSVDRPGELVVNALARAKLCEGMARVLGASERSGEFFLMGMMSRVDAIIGVPLSQVLKNVTLAPDVEAALLDDGKRGRAHFALELAGICETARWDLLRERTAAEDVEQRRVGQAYLEALAWTDQIITKREGTL